MHVVGHDGEGVELVAVFFAIVEEDFLHKFGVGGADEE
jgi:hypothetical protein